MADPHASSMFENPDLAPEEVAARMLVTPTALDDLTLADAMKVVGYMRPQVIPGARCSSKKARSARPIT